MPAFTLSQGAQKLTRFDVVGKYDLTNRYVTHVALSDVELAALNYGDTIVAVHMRPPLQEGDSINAHVLGSVPLTNDEIREISEWIAEIADEYARSGVSGNARQQYFVHPPWKDQVDPNTNVRRYRRYSCVGFVLDGYSQVDILLLQLDEHLLPMVDQRMLLAMFGWDSQRLHRFGLAGAGPWPVVMPGYVLHAMSRSTAQIRAQPYQAKAGDERF